MGVTSFAIDQDRRRQRRRRVVTGVALIAAAGIAIAVAAVLRETKAGPPPPIRLSAVEAPGHVFNRQPYMGVACPVANSIACDRIGLAVWLRRPALTVTATIAGERLALNWRGDRPPLSAGQHPHTAFDGFLRPAGIVAHLHVTGVTGGWRWLGNSAPSPLVRFRIDYGHGRIVQTQERVMLAAGWG
jgi:hypothetical protein